MDNTNDKFLLLLQKLETLYKRQDNLLDEINQLHAEIARLKELNAPDPLQQIEEKETANAAISSAFHAEALSAAQNLKQPITLSSLETSNSSPFNKTKSGFEKFVGENLINKIGIIIIILGIAIGAKYAIDRHLISPLTRIILGYTGGIILLGFAIRLRKNYENFSAVLLSGSSAILYFITYTAYSFYQLMPQGMAFALMLVFTVLTVIAAIVYNKQIIAHIGLVGAYAVPFLLSDGSGKVLILFIYMAIINIGIAVIALKKYWKPLYYVSFIMTWLIFGSWYLLNYEVKSHFSLAFIFLTVFFIIFYSIFLSYKVFKKEQFATHDIFLLLINSFVFYGLGYSILYDYKGGEKMLGLFTLCNALIHSLVGIFIFLQKKTDRNLLYFIFGLMLVFCTIAIPVQLDGNWVTLLWTGEALLLFWIGRSKQVPAYEKISYPLMALAFVSLIQDWESAYNHFDFYNTTAKVSPVINIHFFTSLLCTGAFAWINLLKLKIPAPPDLKLKPATTTIINFGIPFILLCTGYYTFRLEIGNYWEMLFRENTSLNDSKPLWDGDDRQNDYFRYMKTLWIINYSLAFFSAISILNYLRLKNVQIGRVILALSVITIFISLTKGLYILSELRDDRSHLLALFPMKAASIFGIRYISFAFIFLAIFSCFQYLNRLEIMRTLHVAMEYVLHISILWIASSELIHWMNIAGSTQSNKLGLSILWGCYSLFMVILGIRKRKRYLRIAAIGLFGGTLLKLFFYDLSSLDTISKTLVLVALGILLLIISFMYNKYRQII